MALRQQYIELPLSQDCLQLKHKNFRLVPYFCSAFAEHNNCDLNKFLHTLECLDSRTESFNKQSVAEAHKFLLFVVFGLLHLQAIENPRFSAYLNDLC